MKKSTTLIAISTLFVLLISSCTITKRHYMPGYYVNRSHTISTAPAPAEENTSHAKPTVQLTDVPSLNQTNQDAFIKMEETTSPLPTASVLQHNNQPALQNTVANSIERTLTGNHTHQKRVSQKLKKGIAASHDGEGHSLLWILILLILIVWVIGLLAGSFGLGGLIHILLVVALVLLILWLLRIV